ncbi:MAG: hypothetical protein K5865_04900 [Eubacterium sp.]|nr:hypothetical protein [Eubacterium sp.]
MWEEISDQAVLCPNCGLPLSGKKYLNKNNRHWMIKIIFVVFGTMLLLSYFLPWQKISSEKVKNSLKEEDVSKYGELGSSIEEIENNYSAEVIDNVVDIYDDMLLLESFDKNVICQYKNGGHSGCSGH